MARHGILLAGMLLALTPAAALADDDKSANAMPEAAASCLSCHGASGRPVLPEVPIIAGQQPAYLERALKSYREGLRNGGPALVMSGIASDLSDEDIEALAQWFGEQR